MSITVFNNGTVNTVTTGTFAGIIVDVQPSTGTPTTLILSNATVSGPNAHETYPPTTGTDTENGFHGIVVRPGCTFVDAGNNTVTGGNGLAGVATESDGSSGLGLPGFGAGDALWANGATTNSTGTGSTYTGGNYLAGATGSVALQGGAGATIINPVSVGLGNTTYIGGTSESTLIGGPGVMLAMGSTGIGLGITTGSFNGGTGVSTGPSLVAANATSASWSISGGTFSGPIAVEQVSGGSFGFQWTFGGGTLTTSSASGSLFLGGPISVGIIASGSPSVVNSAGPPPSSRLQY